MLVTRVLQDAATPSVAVLHGLDALSQTLCATLDTMELARNVHPDPHFVAAADSAYNQLAGRMHELSTDTRLYGAVVGVLDSPAVRAALNEEQLRFGEAMAAEFESDGAHMSSEARARLHTLQAEAMRCEARFARGTSQTAAGTSGVWAPVAALAELPGGLLRALRGEESAEQVLLPPNQSLLSTALLSTDCGETRQRLHDARENLGVNNLQAWG